ncbi:mucin-4-like isoform X7 [Biomphalaria glabrata]|uniref:protein disulfide-isomerase n=1 Tax=Biomphalaria glabrata TaxID=6526 RepID=A0A9W2YDD0_BIOGL|nr:mucin-4-like isoform X7 [Biomphalaria glabrata]
MWTRKRSTLYLFLLVLFGLINQITLTTTEETTTDTTTETTDTTTETTSDTSTDSTTSDTTTETTSDTTTETTTSDTTTETTSDTSTDPTTSDTTSEITTTEWTTTETTETTSESTTTDVTYVQDNSTDEYNVTETESTVTSEETTLESTTTESTSLETTTLIETSSTDVNTESTTSPTTESTEITTTATESTTTDSTSTTGPAGTDTTTLPTSSESTSSADLASTTTAELTTTDSTTTVGQTTVQSNATTVPSTTAQILIVEIPMRLAIDKNVSGVDLKNTSSESYVLLFNTVEEDIFDFCYPLVYGLLDVIVTNMSQGSLIIDFKLVINTTNTTQQSLQNDVVKVVNGISSSIKIGNVTYAVLTDACALLVNVCAPFQQCVNSSNQFICQNITTSTTVAPTTTTGTTQPPTTTPSGICTSGQGYSWLKKSCQPCSVDENSSNNFCVLKGTNTNNVDLQVTFDYKSTSCQVEDEMSSKGGRAIFANLLAQQPNSPLCANLPNCDNMVFQIKKEDLCKLGPTCSKSANCTDFITRATVNFYRVPEFTKTAASATRRSIEVFVETLSNTTNLNANLTSKVNVVAVLPPVSYNVSIISASENRVAYVKATLNSNVGNLKDLLKANALTEIGQLTDSYLYPNVESSSVSNSQTSFTASFIFKVAINDEIINDIAEAFATSHELFGGSFGDSSIPFTGTVAIFRSQADMTSGKSALKWCKYLVDLQNSFSFVICDLAKTCNDTALFFECVSTEDPLKKQKDLYPYGPSNGDSQINTFNYWWWWWGISSGPVYFPSGAPFGDRKIKVANVQSNGMIRFGLGYDLWWPYLYYSEDYQEGILAPYWSYLNYYTNKGITYYQLYETAVVGDTHKVITTATSDIQDFFKLSSFKVTYVLVATWVNAEPYRWYSWVCDYYQWYYQEWWFIQWYLPYYNDYCKLRNESATFQAVYVTDGETSYTIVTYLKGKMNWQYDPWMPIVVGYANSEKIRDFGVTYTDLTTKMDTLTWNTGRYGTWIEQVGKIENPDSKCLKFYQANKKLITDKTHQSRIDQLYKCPCSLDRVGAQWWGYSWKYLGYGNSFMYCLAIGQTAKNRLLAGNPLNKLCCYRYTYPTYWWDWLAWDYAWRSSPYVDHRNPDGSHLLLNDPWWWWGQNDYRKSREEDFSPHRWCCVDSSSPSKFCKLFNEVRPDLGCSLRAEFISGSALGDPHINTLDGKGYSMNGLGEFILLLIKEISFTLQARTKQALSAAGNATKATVFSAFAAQEGDNATFQVELNAEGDGMIITSCGADLTKDFYDDERYNGSNLVTEVSISRKEGSNKTSVVAGFPSGVSIEVYVVQNYMEFSINVPTSYKEKTSGLLGNYNGNPDDDFVLPNGTILSNSSTERQIFEQFARRWIVTTTNTVFKYKEGENATTYQNFNFEPLYLEEANQTLVKQAEVICKDNVACIFDYVATGNRDFATATLTSSTQAVTAASSQSNSLPVLSLTTSLNSDNRLQVYEGKAINIAFSATDNDTKDVITFQLVSNASASYSINNITGEVTYTPSASEPVLIGVQAKDSKGGLSSIVYISLVVCPTCSSNGTCNLNKTRDKEYQGGKFLLNLCDCWPAYNGDDCEKEVNGCLSASCAKGQDCIDLTPAQQGNNTKGYRCGDCPTGYEERNSTCTDINECANKTAYCKANELCENSVGSYSCYCDMGYRKNALDVCTDINECAERTHKCQQICNNIDGSYNCSCYDGNTLNSDNKTCTKGSTPCNCSDICKTDGTCACLSGYELDSTKLKCQDVDECNNGNKPCSQLCQNTIGGFKCSCFNGFKLDADGVSCKKCSNPYYGKDCASQCVCNGLGTCDNVKGCICNKGWTGTNCNNDVDECTTTLDACPGGQICINTIGSYTCNCPSGYSKVNGTCIDIDECADVLTHNCSLSVEDCINNKGGFSCVCRSGYARNAQNICEDIDECAKHTDNCEQRCENIPGKFNCYCRYGYRLKADRASCVEEKDVCKSVGSTLNCSQSCTVDWTTNVASCFCKIGYDLVGTEQCVDQDECKFNNLCSYKAGCINTPGSFNCSCPAGQILDNDGRSCVACGSGKWGINCANDCACSSFGSSSCDAKIGCICKAGLTGQYCDKDVDECTSGLLKCTSTENCVNTYGSALCQCIDGYTRVGDGCQDINECAFATTNNCDQLCENFVGGYVCKCNLGYTYNTTQKKCVDINECERKMDGCQQGCENSEGGYRCTCPAGLKLKLDGKTCEVDQACNANNSCEEQDHCYKNSTGGEVCYCKVGEVLNPNNPLECLDVDLCNGSACTDYCTETKDNTSFACSCPNGKKLEADGVTCTACVQGLYGANCSSKCLCNPATTSSCDKETGTCTCKSGYTGTYCAEDINECNSEPCISTHNSSCENLPGSYVCKCDAGFFKDGSVCNACPDGWYGVNCNSQCTCDKTHSTCDAATGLCNCFPGWIGTKCDTDSDECTLASNNCTLANKPHWVCFNTPGSYDCDCATGYKNNDGSCTDLDECAAASTNKCSQNCTNTDGSFICSCRSGYTLGADGLTCKDVDECLLKTSTCTQVCTNKEGGFTCSCNTGYDVLETDSNKCYKSDKYSMSFKLKTFDVSNININEPQSEDYKKLKAQIEAELLRWFRFIIGVTRCIVDRLSSGSLIVDFTLIVDADVNPNSNTAVVDVIVNIASNFTIGNQTYSAVFTINGQTVDATTDKCFILNLTKPCASNEKCEISSTNGSAICVAQNVASKSDDIPLIVGLSVGLPLFAALVVAIILIIWYKKKYTQQRRVSSREGHYENEDRPDSRASHSYFAVAPVATDSKQGGKKEDKQNLFP